jgi:hypothetical protein
MFASIEAHAAAYLGTIDASLHQHIRDFLAWIHDREDKAQHIVDEAHAIGLRVLDAAGKEL